MKSLRVPCIAVVILSAIILFTSPICFASGQTPETSEIAKTKDFWLLEAPKEWPAQVMPGVIGGSDKLKTYFDNLVPVVGTDKSILFADVKTVIGPNGSNEQNIGAGLRSLLLDERLILGGNFFYDTRYTENRVRHDQLAFGFEGLSKWVDLRTNFYFPISGKKYLDDQVSYGFRSRSLVSITPYEEPLTGLDYEGGVLIPYLSDYIETRALIGGYNYFPDVGRGLNGIKGRVEIRPIKAFTVNIELRHDNYSGTECLIEGFMTVPLDTMNVFKIKNPFTEFGRYFGYKKGIRPLRERMVDRIVRDINVTVDPKTQKTESVTHNLTYVDNSYTGTSDGSMEHPYTTIANGVANASGDKWVYVNKGSGNYSENVTLANNVALWGSGYNGGFNGITATSNPVIVGGAGVGVTLANNNTVMGLTIKSGLRGIYGQNIQNTIIDHNTVSGNSQEAIKLDIGSSTTGTYTISNNTVTGNGGTAQIYTIAQGTAISTVHIDNNTSSSATGTTRGIEAEFDVSSQGDVRISENTVQNIAGRGIYTLLQNNAILNTCEMTNNIVSNNTTSSPAVFLACFNASSVLNANISGNNVYQNADRAIQIQNSGSGNMSSISITDNTITNNAGNGEGIWVGSLGTGSITTTIARNASIDNIEGLWLVTQSSGNITATVYNNLLSGNTDSGVTINVKNATTGTFTGSFYNNTFKNNVYGVVVGTSGYTRAVTADFGGGSLGSIGYNSIYGNTTYDVKNITTGGVTAQYNWWGTATPAAGQFSGTIDHTNPLSSDPN